jgi:hypothetical protein
MHVSGGRKRHDNTCVQIIMKGRVQHVLWKTSGSWCGRKMGAHVDRSVLGECRQLYFSKYPGRISSSARTRLLRRVLLHRTRVSAGAAPSRMLQTEGARSKRRRVDVRPALCFSATWKAGHLLHTTVATLSAPRTHSRSLVEHAIGSARRCAAHASRCCVCSRLCNRILWHTGLRSGHVPRACLIALGN